MKFFDDLIKAGGWICLGGVVWMIAFVVDDLYWIEHGSPAPILGWLTPLLLGAACMFVGAIFGAVHESGRRCGREESTNDPD